MEFYLSGLFGVYFIFLIVLAIGWIRSTRIRSITPSKNIFISVVVAIRNENENVNTLLQSLASQNYPDSNFEIILIDDHSEDDTVSKGNQWIGQIKNFQIISVPEGSVGKKSALTAGIDSASGEVIATTDADCILPSDWLANINKGFASEEINMLIGAVAFRDSSSLFQQLQSIEFASVIGTGIALAALGKPTMCNGANLSFRKKIFFEVDAYNGNKNIASGDDEFLMRKILDKYPKSVHLLNPIESIVLTNPQFSVGDFIQQRLRWAGKWKANSSLFSKSLALFILMIQISWLLLIGACILNPSRLLLIILYSKIVAELFFLGYVSKSIKNKLNLLPFFLLQFLYPLYVVGIGFFSQTKGYRWKGRTVDN